MKNLQRSSKGTNCKGKQRHQHNKSRTSSNRKQQLSPADYETVKGFLENAEYTIEGNVSKTEFQGSEKVETE
eukprot:1155635-Amphidinium_carterae.1